MEQIQLGLAGATGYAGQEFLRLALGHKHINIAVAMSSTRHSDCQEIPPLRKQWAGKIEPFSIKTLVEKSDVVFLALPDEISVEVIPEILKYGKRVFDFSGAFRLRNDEQRKQWYLNRSVLPEKTSYGLTEWNQDDLPSARLVACPGCYPTAAILALKPLINRGLISKGGDVYIDAKSGISGAGKKLSERTHFSEVHGSISAYEIFSHRHAAEIEQEVGHHVTFVPHLVPLNRGIFETIYTRVQPGTTSEVIFQAFESQYRDSPFVRLSENSLPEIKHVVHTNFCDIGWVLEGTRLVLISCIDNLIKGTAGQALQCFNLAYGFKETEGLL